MYRSRHRAAVRRRSQGLPQDIRILQKRRMRRDPGAVQDTRIRRDPRAVRGMPGTRQEQPGGRHRQAADVRSGRILIFRLAAGGSRVREAAVRQDRCAAASARECIRGRDVREMCVPGEMPAAAPAEASSRWSWICIPSSRLRFRLPA